MKCETIPELKRFLTIQEQALGTASPEVATTVSKLADLYLDRGMLDDAEALYRRALSIRERLNGPHRSEEEDSRRSLNKVLALKGDRLERVSNEMRAAGNTKTPNGGQSRYRPGSTSQLNTATYTPATTPQHSFGVPQQNQNAAGPNGYQPQQSNFGSPPNPPNTTPDHYFTNRRTQAIPNFSGQKNVEHRPTDGAAGGDARTPFRPQDSSTVLDTVPENMLLTSSADALDEAIREARLEVELVRQLTGGDAAQMADCLTRLADLLCRCRMYKEMEPILQEALFIREKRFGLQHHMVATSLKNLARLYYFEGYYDRALPLFERALLIRRRVFGENNVRVADVLDQYAKLLRKMQRPNDATKCEQEANAIKSRSQGWRPV